MFICGYKFYILAVITRIKYYISNCRFTAGIYKIMKYPFWNEGYIFTFHWQLILSNMQNPFPSLYHHCQIMGLMNMWLLPIPYLYDKMTSILIFKKWCYLYILIFTYLVSIYNFYPPFLEETIFISRINHPL